MTDPITTVVGAGTLGVLAKQAQDFIAAASGHPGETIGTILGTLLHRRLNNAEAVMGKTHLILLNMGVDPSEIPLNILQPVLEGASLQEDPNLQDTWANLLANAADPRQLNPVLPSFPAILKELTPREVKFLNALRTRGCGPDRRGASGKAGPQDRQIYDRSTLQIIYAEAGLARCSRLGRLLHGTHSEQNEDDIILDERDFSVVLDVLKRHGIIEELTYPASGYGMDTRLMYKYALSQLGVALVDACQPPKATPETAEL